MPDRKSYHVVPYDNGWEIRLGGATAEHGSLGTWDHKELAVDRAKELAKEAELGQVIIHGRDGAIQDEHTYGDDPTNIPG